ncbi:hypothetical protein YBT020_06540 [Bacillus thuringiensis serovar finitimus YBT-020]|nr:hypothetical protein YBT020_06540 [Bacillus thuringiensis serovar finitimus YBT-020]
MLPSFEMEERPETSIAMVRPFFMLAWGKTRYMKRLKEK